MKRSIICVHKATMSSSSLMVVTRVRETDGQRFGFFICGACYLPRENTLAITRRTCVLCLGQFLSPIEGKCKSCHAWGLSAASLDASRHPWHGWVWLQKRAQTLHPGVRGLVYVPVEELREGYIAADDLENLVDRANAVC